MDNVSARKGARITGDERSRLADEICRKYRDGASIRSLAEETGRSYGFVHGLLVEAEIPLRSRGGATRKRRASA